MESDIELPPTITDLRGGMFFIIGGERIHESDLTPEQRAAMGLPDVVALPAVIAEVPAENADARSGYSVSEG